MQDWMGQLPEAPRSQARLARQLNLNRSTLAMADGLLSPSSRLAEIHKASGVATKIRISRLGIPRSAQARVPKRRQSHNLTRIGFISHLHPHKGAHILLHAALLLIDSIGRYEISIYGSLDKQSRYHARLLNLGERAPGVQFRGHYCSEDVTAILSDLDAIVVPSLWEENSPLVVMLALRCGVPVLASRIGGIPELVADGRNGLLFNTGDHTHLARTLRRVIENPTILTNLARHATYPRTTEDDAHEMLSYYSEIEAGHTRKA